MDVVISALKIFFSVMAILFCTWFIRILHIATKEAKAKITWKLLVINFILLMFLLMATIIIIFEMINIVNEVI